MQHVDLRILGDEFDEAGWKTLLERYESTRLLFPRVRTFRCLHRILRSDVLRIFIQPSLLEARFKLLTPDAAMTALELLKSHAPALQATSLEGSYFSEEQAISDQYSDLLCSLWQLQQIPVGQRWLTNNALSHLSKLPNFHMLSLALPEKLRQTYDFASWGSFSRLTRLVVTHQSADIGYLANFLDAMPRSLVCLHIQVVESRKVPVHVYVSITKSLSRFTTLSNLNLSMKQECSHKPVDASHISSLYCLTNMESFELVDVALQFSRQHIEDMAKAWPRLRKVSIGYSGYDTDTDSFIDLNDIVPFAQFCPLLDSIRISAKPIMSSWSRFIPEGLSTSHARSITLIRPVIAREATDEVKEFLANVFPLAEPHLENFRG